MLVVDSPGYPVTAGTEFAFDTSFCLPMASGAAPQIAPDVAAVPEYVDAAAAIAAQGLRVGAYVGTPIVRPDGELFGTVCGYSPESASGSLYDLAPLLMVFSSLLSAVLAADTGSHRGGTGGGTGAARRRDGCVDGSAESSGLGPLPGAGGGTVPPVR